MTIKLSIPGIMTFEGKGDRESVHEELTMVLERISAIHNKKDISNESESAVAENEEQKKTAKNRCQMPAPMS